MHVWWCLDHVWWCLVVSGACLVVSGARLVMLMDIDWYDLIWCRWADIFSNAYNRCTDTPDAADALMLLINWCYWSNDAAVVDKMQICVWAHLNGIALSSEFRTVVQCLVYFIIWWTLQRKQITFHILEKQKQKNIFVCIQLKSRALGHHTLVSFQTITHKRKSQFYRDESVLVFCIL